MSELTCTWCGTPRRARRGVPRRRAGGGAQGGVLPAGARRAVGDPGRRLGCRAASEPGDLDNGLGRCAQCGGQLDDTASSSSATAASTGSATRSAAPTICSSGRRPAGAGAAPARLSGDPVAPRAVPADRTPSVGKRSGGSVAAAGRRAGRRGRDARRRDRRPSRCRGIAVHTTRGGDGTIRTGPTAPGRGVVLRRAGAGARGRRSRGRHVRPARPRRRRARRTTRSRSTPTPSASREVIGEDGRAGGPRRPRAWAGSCARAQAAELVPRAHRAGRCTSTAFEPPSATARAVQSPSPRRCRRTPRGHRSCRTARSRQPATRSSAGVGEPAPAFYRAGCIARPTPSAARSPQLNAARRSRPLGDAPVSITPSGAEARRERHDDRVRPTTAPSRSRCRAPR